MHNSRDMLTIPQGTDDNFSDEYLQYIQEKVNQSPLKLTGNKFFSTYLLDENRINASNESNPAE